jgi:hypothetical protein
MTALEERIREDGITAVARWRDGPPRYIDDTRDGASWWDVTLHYDGRRMSVPFGQAGPAEPTAADVLYCLLSDSATYENNDGLEEWARDLGVDAESATMGQLYRRIREQAERLSVFLGEQYGAYLWETA